MKRGFTTEEAAVYLGCSSRYIRELRERGDLPVRYLGSKPLYDVADLDRVFESLPAERSA